MSVCVCACVCACVCMSLYVYLCVFVYVYLLFRVHLPYSPPSTQIHVSDLNDHSTPSSQTPTHPYTYTYIHRSCLSPSVFF